MPLHVLLYKAFGWNSPEFAHLPLILKPIGNGKLSKRDGDKMGFPVFPLEWKDASSMTTSDGYRENGFFPEAVINFLALLGWNDGTEQEIFSLEELVQKFDLNRIHKAGAKFDPEKNKWFNHHYLQKQSDESLAESFKVILDKKGISTALDLTKIVGMIKERGNFINEFWDLADYFFEAPTSYDEKVAKNWKDETPGLMQQVISELNKIEDFTSVNIETLLKEWMTTNEIGMGKVMQPLRLSLVGALKGPHLFDIIEMIGKAETVKRIEKAIASL
jgi:glutamyl-tRNA synthetase